MKVAKVIVRKADGKILAVREKESQQWELPGGKIREKEDRFEASRRELKEETGLESEKFEDVVRVEVEDSQTVNCWITFTEDFTGSIELDEDELDDWQFVTEKEYRELDWHADAGYAVPAIRFLDDYLE